MTTDAKPAPSSAVTRLKGMLRGRDAGVVALLIAVWLAGLLRVEDFAEPNTVYFLILDVFPILLIALPMTLIVITAEIDLSVASMVGLSSVLVGVLYQQGWDVWTAAVAALVVGAIGGAINGLLVTVAGLPSLAVTIGTLALFRGIATGLLGTGAVTGFPDADKDLVSGRAFGPGTAIPGVVVVFVALAIGFGVLLHFTPWGRATYAAGLSRQTSRFSGIDVAGLKFWLFVGTSTVAALAGVYWTLRFDSARADNAEGLELAVVAAVLLGGVSIFGGRGSLPGVIAGVLVIGVLRSMLRLDDVSVEVINIATGGLLVASVIFPRLVSSLRKRLARKVSP